MRSKLRTIPIAMAILGILGAYTFVSTSDVYASNIQLNQPPVAIFTASCATCHAADGLGGVTWIKNDPTDKWTAPKIVGLSLSKIKTKVRYGSSNGRMPAFGPEEITPNELDNLAAWLNTNNSGAGVGVSTPASVGITETTPVIVNILDADPWFQDDGTDDFPSDSRRVDLAATDYLKIYNTGRTWHTFTNSAVSKDSGFIGYAGNYKDSFGVDSDLGDMGYYLAGVSNGNLPASGCEKYFCKMHPYMQVEVCTGTGTPAGPTTALGLTRAHKHAKSIAGATLGIGEVWVTAQSQEESTETGTTTVANKSVSEFDGAYQVINTGVSWSVAQRIADVGNNPHNAWPGKDSAGNEVVLSANWHDNTVSLMDANGPGPYSLLQERRSGTGNAHVMVTPGTAERFYVTHMGGRALQQVDVDILRLGGNPNVYAGHIRGATGPHGLWMCDDGVHVLTADTFGKSATLYNTVLKKARTAPSGGKAPLAPAIMSGYGNGCSRGFTNNALTTDVSIYSMTTPVTPANGGIVRITNWTDNPATHLDKNVNGNIDLRNTTTDQVTGGAFQARWAHLPIQTPVSPMATSHGRFMVTANKASFNVSITGLNSTTGLPWGLFTIPAGLGAHGVTYGPKAYCDTDDNGTDEAAANPGADGKFGTLDSGEVSCYYAYVTDTFDDYISVFDLDRIDVNDDMADNNAPSVGMQGPGSALIAETVYVEGGAVEAVVALDSVVASLCDALTSTPANRDPVALSVDMMDGLADGFLQVRPGLWLDGLAVPNDAAHPTAGGDVLDCGVGVMSGTGGAPTAVSLFVNNLPIGVLCPDCRDGVHVGDIPLTLTTLGQDLAYDSTSIGATVLDNTNNVPPSLGGTARTSDGSTSKYTYLKEEVYVDTETITCTLQFLWGLSATANSPGPLNNCDGNTGAVLTCGAGDAAGCINDAVTLDLELGINTGGQGIMGRNTTTGSAPVAPWP